MTNFNAIIKKIMRDLVVNKQLQISFSISYEAKQKWNPETEEFEGPIYQKKTISFWQGIDQQYQPAKKLYFNNEPEFLRFLNMLRSRYKDIYNNTSNTNTSTSVSDIINTCYNSIIKQRK